MLNVYLIIRNDCVIKCFCNCPSYCCLQLCKVVTLSPFQFLPLGGANNLQQGAAGGQGQGPAAKVRVKVLLCPRETSYCRNSSCSYAKNNDNLGVSVFIFYMFTLNTYYP